LSSGLDGRHTPGAAMSGRPKGRIKKVEELHRRYIASEAVHFPRTSDELLRQAEQQARGDSQPSGAVAENVVMPPASEDGGRE
jgi:hypothetical protein